MKKCILVIGHSEKSYGAKNLSLNCTEFDFNNKLAKKIKDEIKDIEIELAYRNTYRSLPSDVNKLNGDMIISLHCNAFNTKVSGTEVLYYHTSRKGKGIAQILQKNLVNALHLKDRGIRPKTSEDRGGYLLRYTKAPCVIAESFFIDNDRDLKGALVSYPRLVNAYITSIKEVIELL